MFRLPQEYAEVIGKYANIYAVDSSHFLIEIILEENPEGNFKTRSREHNRKQDKTDNKEIPNNTENQNGCGGWDLNPGTPAGLAPQASAFDHARQPPLTMDIKNSLIYLSLVVSRINFTSRTTTPHT